jgi:hypothetical protein
MSHAHRLHANAAAGPDVSLFAAFARSLQPTSRRFGRFRETALSGNRGELFWGSSQSLEMQP